MDQAMVTFMDSSRGRGRLLFASDHPVIPARKALDAARALPLSDEGMAQYLGGAAARLFALGPEGS
jgi:predicted TIM-barrel fold metal-dependent hydrolase